jgi:hypothetical protein
MWLMQEHFSTKENVQSLGDPMPLISCALAFLSGVAKRDSFSSWQHAASLPAIPDKNASARRGIRELTTNYVT